MLKNNRTSFDTLIPDGVPEAPNDSMKLLPPWPVNIKSDNNLVFFGVGNNVSEDESIVK